MVGTTHTFMEIGQMQKMLVSPFLVLLTACSSASQASFPSFVDGPKSPAVATKKIVVVTMPPPRHCQPCVDLKALINKMKKNGELKGVDIKFLPGGSNMYPHAGAYPTTYICNGAKCFPPHVGPMSREMILKRLK